MQLTTADDAQIAALLAIAFDADFGGRSFYKQRHHLRLIARENGNIIGHMALCFRAIRLGDTLVNITGLGEVATHPNHRGKGIASSLMDHAINHSELSTAAFFVLFGDRPIYAGRGFLKQPNKLTFTVMDDARTHHILQDADDNLMVLPLRDQVWDPNAHVDLLGPMF